MIITANNSDSVARSESGQKGYSLYLMSKECLPIPQWVIIGKSVFKHFKEYLEIDHLIDQALSSITIGCKTEIITQASNKIRDLILSTPLPKDLEKEIHQAYESMGSNFIAVRSSIADDNSNVFSFAGLHSNFLFVTNCTDAIRYLKECWVSAFSSNALIYRLHHKFALSSTSIDMAVIFQLMVSSEKSGVMFSSDPFLNDINSILINAIYGIGEGLNKGKFDADLYKINKKNQLTSLKIVNKHFSIKKKLFSSGTSHFPVPKQLQSVPCLTNREIKHLSEFGKKIEIIFNSPQEIEWAWTATDGFFILQSRPISHIFSTKNNPSKNFDHLNQIDNINGLTTPLSFGFSQHIYYNGFLLLCKLAGLSKKVIQAVDPFLERMRGLMFGRSYFNIKYLHHLTSLLLPGQKIKHPLIDYTNGKISIFSDNFLTEQMNFPIAEYSIPSILKKYFCFLNFFWFHLRIKHLMNHFCSFLDDTFNEYVDHDFKSLSVAQIYRHYHILEYKFFSKWKISSINNYLSMIYFKLLRTLTHYWLSHLDISNENDLLLVNVNSKFAESTKELTIMIERIKHNDTLFNLLMKTDCDKCLEVLKDSSNSHIVQSMCSFLKKYANYYHNMNIPSFFSLIKKRLESTYDEQSKNLFDESKTSSENLINNNLKGLRKQIYYWCLRKTQQTVQNREVANRYRLRMIQIVNSMFQGIGHNYCKDGIIEKADDIYFLDFIELRNSLENMLSKNYIRSSIHHRKELYKTYKHIDPPSKIITCGPVYWLNNSEDGSEFENTLAKDIRGDIVSIGIAEGKVRAIQDSFENMDLNGELLIISRDKPDCIVLFSSISGLLIENANLLSHTVIIAREMGLPCIINIQGLTDKIKTGMKIRLNGNLGLIKILSNDHKNFTILKRKKNSKELIY